MRPIAVALLLALAGCGDDAPEDTELTIEECEAAGGEAILDPGDGSTFEDGCPDDRELLGRLAVGFEGGICCAR